MTECDVDKPGQWAGHRQYTRMTPAILRGNTVLTPDIHQKPTTCTPYGHRLHTGFQLALISLSGGAVYLGFEVCTRAHKVIEGSRTTDQ